MKKYFINYRDLKNDNKLNFEISPYNEKLKILQREKDGSIKIEPILYFTSYIENIDFFIDMVEKKRKNISFAFELTKEEAKKYNPLVIKEYEKSNKSYYLKKEESKEINLLKYNALTNLKVSDINTGYIFVLKYNKNKGVYEIKNTENIISKQSIKQTRQELKQDDIVKDIYFYTEDEELLEKYKGYKIDLIKKGQDKYELKEYTFIAIDSIRSETVNTFNSESYKLLYNLCSNTIPYYISSEDNYLYEISNIRKNGTAKIYVILDDALKTILSNKNIDVLLKYINVYSYENGKYTKTSIEDYLENKNILKYIKKPNS